jgi:putative membrane protein
MLIIEPSTGRTAQDQSFGSARIARSTPRLPPVEPSYATFAAMNKLDLVFRAFHIYGALMWVGGLVTLIAFLEAHAKEPDVAARGRLTKHVRVASIVPDIGATIALVMGLHWLFKFKLYQAHYMHPKLALVAVLIGLHGYLKGRVKKVKAGEVAAPFGAIKPVVSLLVIGILIFVVVKIPA